MVFDFLDGFCFWIVDNLLDLQLMVPGMWLHEVTPDKYKVKLPSEKKSTKSNYLKKKYKVKSVWSPLFFIYIYFQI